MIKFSLSTLFIDVEVHFKLPHFPENEIPVGEPPVFLQGYRYCM